MSSANWIRITMPEQKQYSLYITRNGVFFEKPHTCTVTLKPVFNERINVGSNHYTVEEARKFAKDLLQVCREVEEISTRFDAYKDDENELREIVDKYHWQ